MRTRFVVVALGVLLAGCDQSPTETRRSLRPSSPDQLLFGVQWTVSTLPFAPAALNDSRVVVGTLAGEAIRWENGTMRALLRPDYHTENQEALAISPLGKIAGRAPLPLMWTLAWESATSQPEPYHYLGDDLTSGPKGINDAGAFIMQSEDKYGRAMAVRFTPGVGLKQLFVQGALWSVPVGMNNAGYGAGTANELPDSLMTYAVRWDPQGNATKLPTFGGPSRSEAINSRSDVIGTSGIGSTIWRFDGTFSTVTGLPSGRTITGWNDAGRIVGNAGNGRPYTFINGVVTYLPTSETNPYPTVVGVNSCGVILGRSNKTEKGFLWARSGIAAPMVCDAPMGTAGT